MPIEAELLSDPDRGVQTKRTSVSERQKLSGRSMQESFAGGLGLNGNSRTGTSVCTSYWELCRRTGGAGGRAGRGGQQREGLGSGVRAPEEERGQAQGCMGHEDGSSQPAPCSWWARRAARGRVLGSLSLRLGLGRQAWHFCQQRLWK